MANIVVTTTATRIDVVFNDMAAAVGYSHGSWPKTAISVLIVDSISDTVIINMTDGSRFVVGDSALIVDSIDAVAMTSSADIYNAIKAFF